MNFPVELKDHLLEEAKRLHIDHKDIEEHFTIGGGPGGQYRNRTQNCVELKHVPTGIHVRVDHHREQHRNRVEAYERLIEHIVEEDKKKLEEKRHKNFLERKHNERRPPKAKEQMLQDKHIRSRKKELRKDVEPPDGS